MLWLIKNKEITIYTYDIYKYGNILCSDNGSGDLKWQNYSTFFQPYLHPAHNHMLAAAILTENQSLKTFLKSRANAFITNDYFQSDKDWMDLDSKIEVWIRYTEFIYHNTFIKSL